MDNVYVVTESHLEGHHCLIGIYRDKYEAVHDVHRFIDVHNKFHDENKVSHTDYKEVEGGWIWGPDDEISFHVFSQNVI